MKFDFFSVLTPIASTTEKAVEFIIRSSDRLDGSTHKNLFFLRQALFSKICLETVGWFSTVVS